MLKLYRLFFFFSPLCALDVNKLLNYNLFFNTFFVHLFLPSPVGLFDCSINYGPNGCIPRQILLERSCQ